MTPSCDEVLARLRAAANPENLPGMARYGIATADALGVSMPLLRGIARELKPARRADPDAAHELALALWASGVHEARILAALVDVPALVTRAQARAWAEDLDSWDVCDQLCGNLLDRVPFAVELAHEWAGAEREFVKRAGFVVMTQISVHDKKAPDDVFLRFLELVEREAYDDRNFVRKAVNWALRTVGKRNVYLNSRAVEVARRLRDSGPKAAGWVASDALRELTDPKVVARIRG